MVEANTSKACSLVEIVGRVQLGSILSSWGKGYKVSVIGSTLYGKEQY